ncbi:leucine-rich repeat-containing protein 73 isoform 2 [Mus musculus]|uniref:Leucine rich repeat containing 73 n=1 Tax=Mus musculus TaxID=10090 RepID=F6U1P7_MOUSE|nr:leucine-rich repeat-containing protein 73 isoform 2 [Mus musculus]
MLPSSIQISGEPLSGAEVRDICRGLRDNAVRLLSLRGCRLCDRDFGRICRALAGATSLAQLNLNLGVVSSPSRIKQLAEALRTNRSIQSLFLHGSPLTDAGLALLNPALALHPALVALDLGDCMLGDEAINLICGLLPPDGAKSGLKELTLSANPGITPKGWSRLAIAVAHSSQVRVLNLDYNPLGDHVAGMLAVAVASSRTLEVLDLEGTGLTNQSAQLCGAWCWPRTALVQSCNNRFVTSYLRGRKRKRWQEGLPTPRNGREGGSLLPTSGVAAPGCAPVIPVLRWC